MSEPLLVGVLAIGAMLFVGAIGVPVAFSMIVVGIGGLWYFGGLAFVASTLKTMPYQILSEYAFAVIPMFILMGALASVAGLTTELYAVTHRLFGRIRGGLLMATTMASAIFGAISGSTIVNATVFTRIALPEMLKYGYERGISAGCIAASGTFAALIPPSISLVIVAILTEGSIGAMLIAGILPGILTAVIYLFGIAVMVRIRPDWAPRRGPSYTLREQLRGLGDIAPAVVLILIVLGGIYSGLMFPSSAGAVGAAGALLIGLMRRRFDWKNLWSALQGTATATAALFFVIIGGLIFSRLLTYGGFITDLSAMVAGWKMTPLELIIAICVLYLILGMFIDTLSVMLITIPFLWPVANHIGVDVIWFAIIVVKMVEIATITPPVGMNLFAVMSASDGTVKSGELIRGVMPFIVIELFVLALLVAFPGISTWLPSQMGN
ncbi:MAG: TRAP transporter large permease [Reyranellaceae bacterium]